MKQSSLENSAIMQHEVSSKFGTQHEHVYSQKALDDLGLTPNETCDIFKVSI